MDPKCAAGATEPVNPKSAMPMHHGTHPVRNRTTTEHIKYLIKLRTRANVVVMQPGGTRNF